MSCRIEKNIIHHRMSHPRQPLLNGRRPSAMVTSRGEDLVSQPETQRGPSVTWRGTLPNGNSATLSFSQLDGSFVLSQDEVSLRNGESRWSQCCGETTPVYITEGGSNLVGAALVCPGVDALELWYMPVHNPGAEKQIRYLRKTPPLRFEDRIDAEEALRTVRAHTSRFGQRPCSRVMVIINPVSGQGKAINLYQKHVLPIFNAAGLQPVEFTTKYRGHATEMVRNAKPEEYSMILSVGGDGTLYEVIQGALNRPDWDEMRKVPLLQVPCGSGNALAACTGLWDVNTAAYAAVKGGIAPLDICSVVQFGPDGQPLPRYYSFLSFAYGMLSCLDIGTEHLRWMGSSRFVVGALQQIWQQKTFPLRVAYLETSAFSVQDGAQEESEDLNEVFELGLGPKLHHLEAITSCRADQGSDPTGALPSGWLWMPAEEIQLFAACNLPRLDMNFHFAPDAHLSSGHLNLLYTAGKAGRRRGLELLTSSERGNHMHLVQQHKPVALYIEPLAANLTWLVVDGELVPHSPLFAEVHPGLCRVVCAT